MEEKKNMITCDTKEEKDKLLLLIDVLLKTNGLNSWDFAEELLSNVQVKTK